MEYGIITSSNGIPHTPASDSRVNRSLIAEPARIGSNTVDHPANLEPPPRATDEPGLEEGGMDTEISVDEETDRTRRPAVSLKIPADRDPVAAERLLAGHRPPLEDAGL
ncbi:hypothetical protein ABZX40_14905 [Streptomyces sp. NPDC004610]|uniref:hypothetical protein n=1 Tax=unclassified Streptomyces TaxID=2593676 RepID=UPI0033A24252